MPNITETQWRKHTSYADDLNRLINDPVFQIALSIVKEKGTTITATANTVDLRDYYAIKGAKIEAYFQALYNLLDLTSASKPPVPDAKAWEQKIEKPNPAGDATPIT